MLDVRTDVVTFYCSVVFISWIVGWYIIYSVTGIHLRSIGVNNGLSFNKVTIASRKVNVSIGSIRFRLWGNTRMIIIDDLVVNLNKTSKGEAQRAKAVEDMDPRMTVFPKNIVGRAVVRFMIKRLPRIDIEARRSVVNYASGQSTRLEYFRLTLSSRYSRRYPTRIKFYSHLLTNNLKQIIGTANKLIDPLTLATSKFQFNLSVDLDNGEIHNVQVQLSIDDFKLSVFNMVKVFLEKSDGFEFQSLKRSEHKGNGWGRLRRFHNKLSSVISSFSINIENVNVSELPFATVRDNQSFHAYFESEQPKTSLDLDVKSVGFNFQKLDKYAAGFAVLFDPNVDVPFHLTTSIQLVKLNYSKLKNVSDDYLVKLSDEILNISSYSFTYKSNVLDHLARGDGFKNCVMELFSSTGSPILDLDTDQLCEVIYNFVLLRKFLTLKKLRLANKQNKEEIKDYESDDGNDIDDTKVELNKNESDSLLRDMILNLLNEYYPKLDTKLIIEQPRFIIRHTDKLKNKMQFLNFSFSSLNFHIMTTESRDYDVKCHILYPSISYHEKSNLISNSRNNKLINKDIISLNSINLHLDILKNLKIKSILDVNESFLDLSQLDIFVGINSLLNDMMEMAEKYLSTGIVNLYLNSEIIKERKNLIVTSQSTHNPKTLEQRIFKYLPDWFIESKINLISLDIFLGSRSILIPKDYLSETYGNGLDSDFIGKNHKLRTIRFSIDRLTLNIRNNNKPNDTILSSSSNGGSSETLTSIENCSTYWSISSNISNFNSSLMLNLSNDENTFKSFIDLPFIDVNLSAIHSGYENNLKLDFSANELIGSYDRYKLFVIVGSIYLLREYLIDPIKLIKSKLKSDLSKFSGESNIMMNKSQRTLKNLLIINFNLDRIDFILQLSDTFKIKFQIFEILLNSTNGITNLNNNFLRVLVGSPLIEDHWCRILCVDSLKVMLNDPKFSSKINILSSSIRFIQPHQFVVHQLFDNVSVTIKLVKFLFTCLMENSRDKPRVIEPKESRVLNIPAINITSRKLSFKMEDDPFESDLNMIYQLGLVEQRKRLEQLNLFDSKANSKNYSNIDEKLYNLRMTMSSSWIRKVKAYKNKLNDEMNRSKKFLFDNEIYIQKDLKNRIIAYSIQPPLLSVLMDNFSLDISTTKFDLSELPQFINQIGQGVPLSTKYSIMIPTFLRLKLDELRIHLRDYPLPLLYVPKFRDSSTPGLLMSGHLIISEALIKDIKHLRRLHIPLALSHNCLNNDTYYSLVIEKSLSTIKFYADLYCKFNSKDASRFVWGQSYQFGIQQVMLNFDQFSKPPIDPSIKLGFWDKLRLILHGKFRIETDNNLEVAFKGSRDPYDLFDKSSGFILSFNEKVNWYINENDDSRSFFDVRAKKLSWFIPNYLATPLIAWSRDSSRISYLPASKSFITTCFAYYLEDSQDDLNEMKNLKAGIFAKKVLNLSGGVEFKVGFLLQRKNKFGSRINESKPHYLVQLYHPDLTSEGHDSYAGFRSDYIHMAISLGANTDTSYNAIHLSPGTFRQFFDWWKLFSGNMMLPIRRGKLFGELKKPMKFSQHLFTNKYQFSFKSLFISHLYRDETVDAEDDKIECIGIKGKMDAFTVDLHERKEPRIQVHEGLSRNKRIMKMNFNIGGVHLSGIDLRVVYAIFNQNIYSEYQNDYNDKKSQYIVFDNDIQWFDIEDYEEAFIPSLRSSKRKVIIHPLLYSKRFSYLRDTQDNVTYEKGIEIFGNEDTHDCLLFSKNIYQPQIELLEDRIKQLENQIMTNKSNGVSTSQLTKRIETLKKDIEASHQKWKLMTRKDSTISELGKSKEKFHNKFILISMFLKWNFQSRNYFLKYIYFVELKSYVRRYLSFESITILEEIIERNKANMTNDDLSTISVVLEQMKSNKETNVIQKIPEISSEERLNNFDNILRRVGDDEGITEDYLVEIISPQIQLQSEEIPDSVVLIAAPILHAKIISVIDKSINDLVINSKELENRYGIILRDANIFVLNKEDLMESDDLILDQRAYGSKSNWPPWLGIEICKDGLFAGADKLLVEKTSMAITYDKLKPLGSRLTQVNDHGSIEHGNEDDVTRQGNAEEGSDIVEGTSDKLQVDIPKFIISSTSKQYFTLYVIVLSLLFYDEPMSKTLSEKLEKLKFSIDFQDLTSLHNRMTDLHKYYRLINILSQNYSFRHNNLDNESLNNYLMLSLERANVAAEVYLLMHSILTGDIYKEGSDFHQKAEWIIRADQIVLHMLEDDRTPILDIAMAHSKYRRIINEDGSNDNRIEIGMMQVFNLIPTARYPGFLEPYVDSNDNSKRQKLITVDWTMNRSVGGIKIMENFEISSQPLNIKIDEVTGEKLMKYIFKSDGESVDESPLLKIAHNDQGYDMDNLDNSDAPSTYSRNLSGCVEGLERNNKERFGDGKINSNNGSKKYVNKDITRVSGKLSKSFNSDSSYSEYQEQIDEMVQRSRNYLSIISFKFNPTVLSISIKLNKGYKKLLNVHNLLIHLPQLLIESQVLSMLEVTILMKKMIIKTLLKHSGKLIKNKLSVGKNSSKQIIKKPLRPLKRYSTFTNISDLRVGSEDRLC